MREVSVAQQFEAVAMVLGLPCAIAAVIWAGALSSRGSVGAEVRWDTQALLLVHTAPLQPLTVAAAHRDMQWHRGCSCPRRAAALAALVEAGHVVPEGFSRRCAR